MRNRGRLLPVLSCSILKEAEHQTTATDRKGPVRLVRTIEADTSITPDRMVFDNERPLDSLGRQQTVNPRRFARQSAAFVATWGYPSLLWKLDERAVRRLYVIHAARHISFFTPEHDL